LALRYFASHELEADVEVDGARRGASERATVVLSEFRWPGCNTKYLQIFANITHLIFVCLEKIAIYI
jgi:hypothetical protein